MEALLEYREGEDEKSCTLSLTAVGLTCSSCSHTVEAALTTLPSVEGAITAPDLQYVLLKTKCAANDNLFGAMEEAVLRVGFSLRVIQYAKNSYFTAGKCFENSNALNFCVVTGLFLLMTVRYGMDYSQMLFANSFNVCIFFLLVCGLQFVSTVSCLFRPHHRFRDVSMPQMNAAHNVKGFI